MNGRERVEATLAGGAVDRRPVAPLLSLYGCRLAGTRLSDHFSDPRSYLLGQTAVQEEFAPDIQFGPFALALEAEAFGSRLVHHPDRPPTLAEPAAHDPEGFARLAVPDVDSHPAPVYFRESVRLMLAELGRETLVAAVVPSPLDLAALTLGLEGLIAMLLFDPDGARRTLEALAEYTAVRANAHLSDGAHAVILPLAAASTTIAPRPLIERMMIPAMTAATRNIEGPVLLHSGGAPLLPTLDLALGVDRVVGFVMNPGESLGEARRIAGPDVLVAGNLDGAVLDTMTVREIESKIEDLLTECAPDRRVIVATSGPDIPLATPPRNIAALVEAVEHAGAPRAADSGSKPSR